MPQRNTLSADYSSDDSDGELTSKELSEMLKKCLKLQRKINAVFDGKRSKVHSTKRVQASREASTAHVWSVTTTLSNKFANLVPTVSSFETTRPSTRRDKKACRIQPRQFQSSANSASLPDGPRSRLNQTKLARGLGRRQCDQSPRISIRDINVCLAGTSAKSQERDCYDE